MLTDLDALLQALDRELERLHAAPMELCIVGGSALNALGFVSRPTKDVDVLASCVACGGTLELSQVHELPLPLQQAASAVARQFGLEPDWLNTGPTSLLDCGLPDGFESRLSARRYGDSLVVHFPSRLDQICLKTYAAADVAGRHLADLQALRPTRDELGLAASWVRLHDDSVAFGEQLRQLLEYMGVSDADR